MASDQLNLILPYSPVVQAVLLIRKPAEDISEAFVNPSITTRFWFAKSSGRLEAGKRTRWDWEMYGMHALVEVKELDPSWRILLDWEVQGNPTTVEWKFSARTPESTFIPVTNYGFTGDSDKIVEQALDSATGFQLVLAGLKAYLEYGINLNVVADRHPDLIENQLDSGDPSRQRRAGDDQ